MTSAAARIASHRIFYSTYISFTGRTLSSPSHSSSSKAFLFGLSRASGDHKRRVLSANKNSRLVNIRSSLVEPKTVSQLIRVNSFLSTNCQLKRNSRYVRKKSTQQVLPTFLRSIEDKQDTPSSSSNGSQNHHCPPHGSVFNEVHQMRRVHLQREEIQRRSDPLTFTATSTPDFPRAFDTLCLD